MQKQSFKITVICHTVILRSFYFCFFEEFSFTVQERVIT